MIELLAAAIQTRPVFGDIPGNVERALARIPDGCELAVLPELFATGYQFRSRSEAFDLAEDVLTGTGATPTCDRLAETARKHNLTIVAGLAERCGSALYNSSVLFRPDGTREIYRKIHLFLDEKSIFDPGDLGFPVFEACGTRLGMMICFDWVFPEAARSLALGGAEVICHPANLVLPWCPAAMVTRSQENRVFTVTSNRTGREHRRENALEFIGMSQIVGPAGERLAHLGAETEGAAGAVLRIVERDKRITPLNDLWEDRRPDQYRL